MVSVKWFFIALNRAYMKAVQKYSWPARPVHFLPFSERKFCGFKTKDCHKMASNEIVQTKGVHYLSFE
jgi:hypothetical protein